MPSLGFPVKLSATPQQVRHPAPLLGEHTEQVLAEFGLGSAALAALRERGAFEQEKPAGARQEWQS